MKSNKNKKLIAIILPAFLVTSGIEPAFAAELIMGANGQVQSVVSAEQTQAESSLPTEQVPEDLFEEGALSAPTAAEAVNIPGTLVDTVEDDRITAYIYSDANGKRQAVIYDKATKKVISKIERVGVKAGEQVLFFDAPRIDNPLGKGYILHLKPNSHKLTVTSNLYANQIDLTPNKAKIIFMTASSNGNSSFGIYDVAAQAVYFERISQYGMGGKIVSIDTNNHYAVVLMDREDVRRLVFIPLSNSNRLAYTQALPNYNTEHDVVTIPGFVKGLIYDVSYQPAAGTFKTTTNWGEQLVFKVTGNGQSVYLQQYEGWERDGNPSRGYIDRQYTKIIFGADGKRNHMWIKKYDSRGRIEFEQEVIYDANGNVKRVIAYRYTLIRGKIVKVAI